MHMFLQTSYVSIDAMSAATANTAGVRVLNMGATCIHAQLGLVPPDSPHRATKRLPSPLGGRASRRHYSHRDCRNQEGESCHLRERRHVSTCCGCSTRMRAWEVHAYDR